jgi:hypothetical protein
MKEQDFNTQVWDALKKVYGSNLYSAKVSVILREPSGIQVNMAINFPPQEEFFE